MNSNKFNLFKHSKSDLLSGVVVFLVALPLCLGIALASGAPLFSGIIAGVIGGIVVGLLSGSHLSVSGPAAGLTVIVLNAIDSLGGFEFFLVAVVLAGVFQVLLGMLRAGIIGLYFPSSVIKGMLAAIGLILILKQIPHFLGVDTDTFGEMDFFQPDGRTTLSELGFAMGHIDIGALIVGVVSLVLIIIVDHPNLKKFTLFNLVPGALVAVVAGILLKLSFDGDGLLSIQQTHLVNLPDLRYGNAREAAFAFPSFSILKNPQVYVTAITIAIIASLETLLSLEAVDKLDPLERHSPKNRELIAQGIGNTISGLIGGLPMTAVIVRSSANVAAGGKTRLAAISHGIFLVIAVFFIPGVLNHIPLSSLAAVLLVVGYKLTKPLLYKQQWKLGFQQFFPFIITIVVVLLTDLLIGISVGMAVGVFFILRSNYKRPFSHNRDIDENGIHRITIELSEHVTFLNKANIQTSLDEVPDNSEVIIDGSKTEDIGFDEWELIQTFNKHAQDRKIKVELRNIPNYLK